MSIKIDESSDSQNLRHERKNFVEIQNDISKQQQHNDMLIKFVSKSPLKLARN